MRCQNTDGVSLLLKLIRENAKLKLQALNLLKLVSGNAGCAREIISNLSALFNLCTVPSGRRNTGHVRTILQIITKAIKSSNANCAKTMHLIGTVVDLIESWHNYDRKHGGRLIQIRKAFFVLLSTMATVKQNREKICELDIMQKLYTVCECMIRKNAPEQLTKLLINTMHKSLPMIKPMAIVPQVESEFDIESEVNSRWSKKEEEEVPSIEEQYPDLSIFDSYFPERNDIGDAPSLKALSASLPGTAPVIQHPSCNHTMRNNTVLNLPKLSLIRRRKSTTNLPQSVKNAQSVSLPNLVFPKVSCGVKQNQAARSVDAPIVSPRLPTSQKSFPCIQCTRSKSCVNHLYKSCEAENILPLKIETKDSTKGYATGPSPHSTKFQAAIEGSNSETRTIDRYGDARSADVVNVIPCCEVYGQMSSSPVAQVKTKLSARQDRLFLDIERYVYADRFVNKLIYAPNKTIQDKSKEIGQLWFESRFESGNLAEVYLAKDTEYDLWLEPDLFQDNHRQWFFFQVGNMAPDVTYSFNILNFEKRDSQFGRGMQPVMFSTREAIQGYPIWRRVGTNIIYYKNNIKNRYSKAHYSVSFDVKFKHHGDTVYLAYHYPYTYTRLRAELSNISGEQNIITSCSLNLTQTYCSDKFYLPPTDYVQNNTRKLS